ncbi:class I SAM-dependent methyltransferase [Streptomyces sp. NPDC089799]|uniref:class I SAM-dependent methyltransferase n=1 Tax=Streptomyces sp. NPDC089799 TaxID=3155066 RepID=UPI00343FF9C0
MESGTKTAYNGTRATDRGAKGAYKGTSTRAIVHQYDYLGDFYQLLLGERLVYSYGMWEDGDTLEKAQLRKLDHHAEAARATGAARVLDVGCGYGSLLQRLVEDHGVKHAVGLNMSPTQTAWARDQNWPGCEVRVENWFDHRPEAPYDAIIAIEAVEHFAGNTLWRSKRVARYRQFFERSHAWLRPGGRMSIQANAWDDRGWLPSLVLPPAGHRRPGAAALYDGARNVWEGWQASRKVYPETCLPTLSELNEASSGLFRLIETRRDPQDGVATVTAWTQRAEANRQRGAGLIGAKAVSDVISEQRTALRFLREGRFTLIRLVLERL